ncbi:glycosyl hydrolase [Clostridia bacterium]|nr:glycosyl hydrolase [Clostridia bacterium]
MSAAVVAKEATGKASIKEESRRLVAQMTLDEKCGMLSGSGFWNTKAVPRLNIPSVMMCDGPHGLRKQLNDADQTNLNNSITATAFPTAPGIAASFDRALAEELGALLGEECQAEDVALILGPGANIKRSPLCGRNFEYYSEDPLLSGEMAAAHIRGVQSKGVGACLKHYAVNNQEHRRMSVDAQVDERALREIYLASFEYAVKGSQPWSIMGSYNKVNGTHACENPWLLTDILRNEWGFDGFTVTDWGACADHPEGVNAGMDLAMPATGVWMDRELSTAALNGKASQSAIDAAAARVVEFALKAQALHEPTAQYDRSVHHHQARRIARETSALLKNDDNILPIRGGGVAFIGEFAQTPRYQGAGSSHINPSEITSALAAVRSVDQVTYARGYDVSSDEIRQDLLDEAVAAARSAKIVVLFVGLPDRYESEGFDRVHLRLPANQDRLIRDVAAVCKRVVVVLHNGAPIEMPWIGDVQAVLEMYLGGQAVGGAAVDLLYGAANPCGKLAETFPLRLSDTPCYTSFPGEADAVRYGEGVFVGYRHYDSVGRAVLFPFGHGLSYTSFKYGALSCNIIKDGPSPRVTVSCEVTNGGAVAGKEIVQLYVRATHHGIVRPVQELRGFDKIHLEPGETKTVTFELNQRAFAYWDEREHDWIVEPGAYEVRIGASSRDIRLTMRITLSGRQVLPIVSPEMTVSDAYAIPGGAEILDPIKRAFAPAAAEGDNILEMFLRGMPLRAVRGIMGDNAPDSMMDQVLAALSAARDGHKS